MKILCISAKPNVHFYLSKWPRIKKVVWQNVFKIKFYFQIHRRHNSRCKISFSQESHCALNNLYEALPIIPNDKVHFCRTHIHLPPAMRRVYHVFKKLPTLKNIPKHLLFLVVTLFFGLHNCKFCYWASNLQNLWIFAAFKVTCSTRCSP